MRVKTRRFFGDPVERRLILNAHERNTIRQAALIAERVREMLPCDGAGDALDAEMDQQIAMLAIAAEMLLSDELVIG